MRPGTRNPPHKATYTKNERHKAIMTGVRIGTGAAPHDVMSNGVRNKDEGRRRDSEDTMNESDESDEELEVYSKNPGELNPDNTYFNFDLVALFWAKSRALIQAFKGIVQPQSYTIADVI